MEILILVSIIYIIYSAVAGGKNESSNIKTIEKTEVGKKIDEELLRSLKKIQDAVGSSNVDIKKAYNNMPNENKKIAKQKYNEAQLTRKINSEDYKKSSGQIMAEQIRASENKAKKIISNYEKNQYKLSLKNNSDI